VTDLPPSPQTPSVAPLSSAALARVPVVVAVAGGVKAPSLAELYAAEARWVWRALWRLGVPERDLEDVAHDVFVVVHRKLVDYDPTRPVRPWLFGICFRVALDRRKKASTTREQLASHDDAACGHDTAAVQDDAVAVITRKQQSALVQRALLMLPLEQRAVLVLHELEGLAVVDCVAVLDAPLNTLYSRLRLARVAFARAVAHLAPADGSRS
jgi:RNA polymerase sigma-70 factor (ECF subfamily)